MTKITVQRLVLFSTLLLLPVLSLLWSIHWPLNWDAAAYLYNAQELLRGAHLYTTVGFDPNPPMITFLSMPAAVIAKIFSLNLFTTFKVYFVVLSVASLGITWRIFYQIFGKSLRNPATVFMSLFTILFFFALGVNYAQREHFFVLLALPYIATLVGVYSKRNVSQLAIVISAILLICGLLIKPHFLLFWIITEGCLIFGRHKKIWRLQNIIIAIGVIGYYAFFYFALIDYRSVLYFIATTYSAWFSISGLWRDANILIPVIIFIVASIFLYYNRKALRHREFFIPIYVALVGFIVVAFVQPNIWPYHFITAKILGSAMMLTLIFVQLQGQWRQLRLFSFWGFVLLFNVAFTALLLLSFSETTTIYPLINKHIIEEVNTYLSQKKSPTVFFATVSYERTFTAMQNNDFTIATRLPALWMLPQLQIDRDMARQMPFPRTGALAKPEKDFFDILISDLNTTKPDIVIFEILQSNYLSFNFDAQVFFSRDPRFTTFLENYHQVYASAENYIFFERNN